MVTNVQPKCSVLTLSCLLKPQGTHFEGFALAYLSLMDSTKHRSQSTSLHSESTSYSLSVLSAWGNSASSLTWEKSNTHLLISQYALTTRQWWKSFHACPDGTKPSVLCHQLKTLVPRGDHLLLQSDSLGCEVGGMNPGISSLGGSLQVCFVHLAVFCSGKYGSCLTASIHFNYQWLVSVTVHALLVTPHALLLCVTVFDTSAFLVCSVRTLDTKHGDGVFTRWQGC